VVGAVGSASLAMARCAISTLHLPRTSFLDEFRLLSKKSGQFMCTTVTMVIMTPDHCAPKHKSPSTLARDAARSKKHKERLQSNNAAAAVHQPRPSAPRARRSIGFSSELPAPSSPISALSVPSGSPILPPIAAKRARLTLARSEAVNPPLLVASTSSHASSAPVSSWSPNLDSTKQPATSSTSGMRSESIQAPSSVPSSSRNLFAPPAPATPSLLSSSSGQPSRPTAAPPDTSSAPTERSPYKSILTGWRGILSMAGRR